MSDYNPDNTIKATLDAMLTVAAVVVMAGLAVFVAYLLGAF